MKVALLQISSSDDPDKNARELKARVEEAAATGARLICTPEVSNCVSLDRSRQSKVLKAEDEDTMLADMREAAARHGAWINIGSLALKGGADNRFLNRSFMIAPDGSIAARYDKIHMFDVDVSDTERYRESDGYAPGSEATLIQVDDMKVGMTICYDIRFPQLYRKLAHAGADIILVPSAFSPVTGAAHWHALLRARAIENGCYVLASAQTGRHASSTARARDTYGHTLAVSPWGQVMADAGTECGITYVDLDRAEVSKARRRIPSLTHDRSFTGP
ncbi:MAG: carbon-nitrogen hydrolase family protein [Pseudomonadota bacterium]